MVFEDLKTVFTSFCILGKSGEAVYARDDVDEDDDVDETVEDGRSGRLAQAPRLMVNVGYVTISSGGRSIMKVWLGVADTVRRIL